MTIPYAGHFVPMGNYDAAKASLDDFIQSKELKCKKTDGDKCSVEPKMCDYMKDCFGVGTCENGMCKCPDEHKGADCSYEAF